MANDLTKKPWFVDTASGTNLTNDEVVIDRIVCIGDANAAGDAAIISDGSGKTIARFRATGANFHDEQEFYSSKRNIASARFTGLRVPTLTSGMQLYIHLA